MSGLRDALRRHKHRLMCVIAPKAETIKYYRAVFGKDPDFVNPVTINEKIQILKLGEYTDNQIITECVDKYRVREYLKRKNLEGILPGILGAYDRAEDIDWESLPDKFVIKCNHGCGYNLICKKKNSLDRNEAVKKLNRWMREDYWKEFCEPQYKNVRKKILIEEYLGDDIETYKFYCFNGKPRVIYVMSTDGDEHYVDFYDLDWNHIDLKRCGRKQRPDRENIVKPPHLKEMLQYSEELSADFPFVRVDLYDLDNGVFFSELTFVPAGGFLKMEPESAEAEWGSWLDISGCKKV